MAGLLRFVLLALALKTNSVSSALVKRASGVTSSAAAANGQTFDYIVVGAGLAGTTVAARLAEDSSVSVLLIEAGADNRNDPRVYDIYRYGEAFNSELTWSWPADQGKSILGYDSFTNLIFHVSDTLFSEEKLSGEAVCAHFP